MKLAAVFLLLLLALVALWSVLGAPGMASSGSTIFLPWVMKEAKVEEVAIVQRDGRKAVYWPGLTPTLVSGITIYLEAENRTSRSVTGVTVDFRAFDSSGALITQTVTQTAALVEVLRPGQRSPVAFNIPFPGGYTAFQAASKSFTLLPDWGFTDYDTQGGLEIGWGYPWYTPPPPPYPTPTPYVPAPPNISGWVRNNGATSVSGVSVVVTIRGNERVQGLVLEAAKATIYGQIYPGSYNTFYTTFSRDYGSLYSGVEAVAQRRVDIPGILEAPSW